MVDPSDRCRLSDRVFAAARLLKQNGFDDVIPILMRGQARAAREARSVRRRGVKVKLLGGRANAVLDEQRVQELAQGAQRVREFLIRAGD